jgi:hypothetical protein
MWFAPPPPPPPLPHFPQLFTFAIQDRTRGQLTLRIFHNEECVCFTSVPLSCLRVGYRSMTLFEENEDNNFQIEGLPLSKLFLRIGLLQSEPMASLSPGDSVTGGRGGGGDSITSSPIQRQYSKEFSPAMSPSPSPPPRSRDTNSRMVGMDVSPGNKHWRRFLRSKSGASDAASREEAPDFFAANQQETPSPKQHYHVRRSASMGDALPPPSSASPSRASHRDSRDRRRSRRERGVPSRSQSGPVVER